MLSSWLQELNLQIKLRKLTKDISIKPLSKFGVNVTIKLWSSMVNKSENITSNVLSVSSENSIAV